MLNSEHSNSPRIGRRRFLQLGAASAVAAALAGCSNDGARSASSASSAASSGTATVTTFPASTTTVVVAPASGPAPMRSLVVVQLMGGNDALNTLIPSDGRYRDARPTLAIPEADRVALRGVSDWSLHPSMASLTNHWEAGTAAFLPGIGFNDPNYSHFVSLDRWWRADDLGAHTGWLGRSLTPDDSSPLFANALGGSAPLLLSDSYQPAVIVQPSAFDFPRLLPADVIGRLSAPAGGTSLDALARASLQSSIAAVEAFARVRDEPAGATTSTTVDPAPAGTGALDLVSGLDLAARLVTGDVGARIVVVSVSGFDTHSNQLTTQAGLLSDLAAGVDAFLNAMTAAGRGDQTLLVTASEFGRRVAENASGGFDHGAGGLSMMFGGKVIGGIHGSVDLGDQLDGNLCPTLDPRTMYTACLDWLGADPVTALGKRYDEVALLRA